MNKGTVCGIYKITSPTGGIYIGQSVNVQERIRDYKKRGSKSQKILHRSFLKYGIDSHSFELICELPNDISKEDLTKYEQIYLDQHIDCGFNILNACLIVSGGVMNGRKHSPETCAKIGESKKGNKNMLGKKHTEQAKARMHLFKNGSVPANKGKPMSDEAKAKLIKKLKGRKINDTHKENIGNSQRGIKKKPFSKQHRENMAAASKGRIVSEETKNKIREKNKGRKMNPEHVMKMVQERINNGTFKNSTYVLRD